MDRPEQTAVELAHQVVADAPVDAANANLLVFSNATARRLLD